MKIFKSFRLPHWSTLIGLIVLIGILVGDRMMMKRSYPDEPVTLTLEKNMPLLDVTYHAEQIGQVRKGETVQYLGVMEGGGDRPCGLLVQKTTGERGLISSLEMGYPLFVKNKKDSTHIRIEKYGKSSNGATCHIINGAGVRSEVRMKDIRPVLPENMRHQILNDDGAYFMTKQKFENLYIGSTFAENEARYRPSMHVARTKNGWTAFYLNLTVLDLDNGHLNKPIIEYNAQGVATGYSYAKGYNSGNNKWVIRWMPMLGRIVDNDLFARLIEGSLYENWIDEVNEGYGPTQYASLSDVPWHSWAIVILYIILIIVWIFLMCTLPSLIADASLYCRWIYYHLPDGIVALLFAAVGLVSLYIWTALMAAWGCLWLFLPIIPITGLCGIFFSQRYLATSPSSRCPECRRMEVNEFVKREFNREYNEWRHESKKVDSHTSRWQTWTEVTTKYSNGSTTKHKENVQNHSRTETLYADYNVLYHVKEYYNYYECQGCGYIEKIRDEELQELQRMHSGHHTTVSTT